MTAPAIAQAPAAPVAPQAPAAAPQAPVQVEVTQAPKTVQQEVTGWNALIDKIARKPIPADAAFAEQNAPAKSEVPTAPDATLSQVADASVATPLDSPTAESVQPPPATEPAQPSGMVLESVVEDGNGESYTFRTRDPATGQFAPMDLDRIHEWEGGRDKSTGEVKVYRKSTREMQRLAVDGIAMQKSIPELQHYRQNVPQWQAQHAELSTSVEQAQATIKQYEALTHALLTDPPETVDARRQQYAEQFTPERRIAQLESQLRAFQTGQSTPQPQSPQQNPQLQAHVQQFAQHTDAARQDVERLVGIEAATKQIAWATRSMLVNGQIPPERLPEIAQYINGPFREWAQAEASKQSAVAKELEAARQERARAQQAARNVGTATRPTGGAPSSAPVTQGPAKSREDAITRIVHRPVGVG